MTRQTSPPDDDAGDAVGESRGVRWVLYGDGTERVRATWRVVAAVVAFAAVFAPLSVAMGRVPLPGLLRNAPILLPALAGTVAVTLVGRRLEGRSIAEQGFSLDRSWWYDFIGGVGLGSVSMALTLLLWMEVGAASVVETLSTGSVSGPAAVVAVVTAAIGYLGVGLWEEVMYRGVVVRNGVDGLVTRGLSRRVAVILMIGLGAVIFGLPHFLVPAQGALPIFAAIQAVSAVVYFTTAYVLTESLALPIGLHFSMNFTNAALFPTGSSVPALVRMNQTLSADPLVIAVTGVSTVLLTLGVVAWVRVTRGSVSVTNCFS